MIRARASCCFPEPEVAPLASDNAPHLPQLRYRVGDYASFVRGLFRNVETAARSLGWSTRDPSDFAAALLHSWAYVADVLTFYQERIANEAYVATAQQEDSLRRIAALVGYVPKPAVSASVTLQFEVDPGTTSAVAAGTRVESVPSADGEKPQRFETTEALSASASLNSVIALPVPESKPVSGSEIVLLEPGTDSAELPAAGESLLLHDEAGTFIEEHRVKARGARFGVAELVLERPVAAASVDGAVFERLSSQHRVFGYGAPPSYIAIDPAEFAAAAQGAAGNGGSRAVDPARFWKVVTISVDAITTQLDLEGAPAIAAGARVLLWDGSQLHATTVKSTERAVATLPKNPGNIAPLLKSSVTRLTLDSAAPDMAVDQTTVFVLGQAAWRAWNRSFPDRFASTTFWTPKAPGVREALNSGRRIVLTDGSQPIVATVTSIADAPVDGFSSVDVDQPLDGLDATRTSFCGNLVPATHGETLAEEVLGDGSQNQSFQRFQLKRAPLTFFADASSPRQARAALEIWVGGIRYREVPNLDQAGPEDRVYVLEVDELQHASISFGDGQNGARLPTGLGNVRARYRQGAGALGNVGSGQIRNLVSRPLHVRGVNNPVSAQGGDDADDSEALRANIPSGLRTLGRVVSLRDYEDTARAFPGVRKARASTRATGLEEQLRLVIAGEGGSAGPKRELYAFLAAQADPNQALTIESATPQRIRLTASVRISSDYDPELVRGELQSGLLASLGFAARPIGKGIALSQVLGLLHGHPAVTRVDVQEFKAKQGSADGLANALGVLRVGPDEIAFLDAGDLTLSVSAGSAT